MSPTKPLVNRILVRRRTIALVCWLAGVFLCNLSCDREPASGPHVVLISIDTLRADHVGLYGYGRETTPNIDRFFGTRTVFENAMSSAPCTIPAVRQFLSGAFDHRPDRRQLPEFLRDHGYATAAIVSQHQFFRHPVEAYRRGFEHFDIQARDEVDHHGWTARRAEEVSDRAIGWLKENGQSERFFLWLHYFDPHDPYEPPPDFRAFDRGNRSRKSGDRRSYLREAHRKQPIRTAKEQWGGHIFDDEDVAHFVNLYDGEVAYTDFHVGRVLAFLAENNLVERSIVVLISDHGEWLGEIDRWDHCYTLRDLEIRVPFMISVNGEALEDIGAKRMPASTLDVLPTLLGLLNIDYPNSDYHGEDLRRAPPDRTVVAMWSGSRVIRNADWKLFYDGMSPAFLYQVGRDADERWNRIRDKPEIVDLLDARMESLRPLLARVKAQDDQTIEQLEQLGYIEP
jgi:arylsulfatase A-like enzyme